MDEFNWENRPSVSPRLISIISYFSLPGWIVALVLNNPRSELASFHLRQSLGVMIFSMAIGFVRYAPFFGQPLGAAAGLFVLVLWITGLLSAVRSEEKPVPVLGEQFQEWFRNL